MARVLNSFANVLDALLPVRDQASVAHPNAELLDEAGAQLVINVGRDLLEYVDPKLAWGRSPCRAPPRIAHAVAPPPSTTRSLKARAPAADMLGMGQLDDLTQRLAAACAKLPEPIAAGVVLAPYPRVGLAVPMTPHMSRATEDLAKPPTWGRSRARVPPMLGRIMAKLVKKCRHDRGLSPAARARSWHMSHAGLVGRAEHDLHCSAIP